MQKNYRKTLIACYLGFITQAITANFTPLLFLKFHADYQISLGRIALIPTAFFLTQLIIDLLCARFVDAIGYRKAVIASEVASAAGLVGLAFLSICSFWQMYDNVIPLILTDTFRLNETFSGAIMAADNILALFLLPFFGTLSDRTDTKLGKRTPYILGGTLAAVILLNILPLLDNSYYAAAGTGKMIAFVVALGLLLISMGTYRSPAVALMPDVTPKPLRSRANAIINLMGAVGGIIYLAIAAVMYPNSKVLGLDHVN